MPEFNHLTAWELLWIFLAFLAAGAGWTLGGLIITTLVSMFNRPRRPQ